MGFDEPAAVGSFWSSRPRGVYFPKEWFDKLSLDEAYRIQLGILDRRCAAGERHIGWKVGLTAEPAQQEFGCDEPVFGCLMESHPSGHVFRRRDLVSPGFEAELCLRVSQPLTGEVSLREVCRAVDQVYPALEIIETRGDSAQQFAVSVADNVRQRTVVLGNPVRLGALELNGVAATIQINGSTVATGLGAAVLSNPLKSLVWLARKLADYGRGIRAGDLVMTGSFARQFPLEPGDRVHVDFVDIGDVQACLLA
jgi:2-keto-4-pentenoate hydratase